MVRSRCHFLGLLFLITTTLPTCGPGSKPGPETKATLKPLGLIFESVIEGEILYRPLMQPRGLTSDNAGNLYVIDAGNNRLVKFDRKLQAVREAGGFGSADGLLNAPTHITVDNGLSLYVSDAGNQRIAVYDTRLNFGYSISLTDIEDPLKYGRPAGLAVNEYGEVLVADRDNSRLVVFNSFGNFDRFIGGVESSAGRLLMPSGLCLGPEAEILACDLGNSRIEIFDALGIYDTHFGDRYLGEPSGIGLDPAGNIWVVDRNPAGLYCFDRSGAVLFSIARTGASDAFDLGQPYDLAFLPDDRIVVSDSGNDRLLIYRILYPE
ncbi:MAG: NHL repeat-containing protein [Candidatus Zixiibacteriota bacterium]|nr:MAG: NHL repeat-containing protein [candidate division Zixibacteria bacterium]